LFHKCNLTVVCDIKLLAVLFISITIEHIQQKDNPTLFP